MISDRFKNYGRFFSQLTKDTWAHFRLSALTVIILTVVAVLGQSGAFIALIASLNAYESDEPISIGDYVVPIDFSETSFIIGILIGGTILVLGFTAFLQFWTSRQIINIATKYDDFTVDRLLCHLSRIATRVGPPKSVLNIDRMVRATSIGAVSSGQCIRRFLQICSDIPFFFAYLAVLIYVDWQIPLAIGIIGLGYLVLQYRVNLLGANATTTMQAEMPKARKKIKAFISETLGSAASQDKANVDQILKSGPRIKAQAAFLRRGSTAFSSLFLSRAFTAVGMLTVLVIASGAFGQTQKEIGEVIIILVLLRQAMGSMASIFAAMSTLNLYYPAARECQDYRLELRHYAIQMSSPAARPDNSWIDAAFENLGAALGNSEDLDSRFPLRVLTPSKMEHLALVAVSELMKVPIGAHIAPAGAPGFDWGLKFEVEPIRTVLRARKAATAPAKPIENAILIRAANYRSGTVPPQKPVEETNIVVFTGSEIKTWRRGENFPAMNLPSGGTKVDSITDEDETLL